MIFSVMCAILVVLLAAILEGGVDHFDSMCSNIEVRRGKDFACPTCGHPLEHEESQAYCDRCETFFPYME